MVMNNLNCMDNQTYTASGLVPPPQYKILALFGKSGAGKDTIQQWIVNNIPNTKGIVSYTTRPKRDYEVNGKDYYFIDDTEFAFKKQQGLMLETTCFRDWYYGTSIETISPHYINVGVFNIQGVCSLLADGRIKVLPVQIEAPPRVRLERNFQREHYPDYTEICRRFLADEKDFQNICFEYVYFNNSDDNGEYFNIQNIPAIREFLQGQ